MKKKFGSILLIFIMLIAILGIILTINHARNNLVINMGEGELIFNESPNTNNNSNTSNNFNVDMDNNPTLPDNNFNINENLNHENFKLPTLYLIIIVLFCGLFSTSFLYFLMQIKNLKFYKNKDKLIIYILSNLLLIPLLTLIVTILTNNILTNNINIEDEKDKVILDESSIITDENINLDEQTTDVTITTGGIYTLTGSFSHSIIIDANLEDVELVLNGVEITNEQTATIIGLSANKITIVLADGIENILSDGGNSEYDGCIFSNAELILEGTGKLIVNGNQNGGEGIATEAKNITINSGTIVITSNDDGINAGLDGATITINGGLIYIDASGDGIDSNKDALINGGTLFVMGSDIGGDSGIDTDEGYTINGGLVVALGSDMIETPKDLSNQKTMAFSLNESINKNTLITLMKDSEVIVSFKASKNFKTIIISSENITDGNYTLYKDGTNTGTLEYGIYQGGEYQKGNMLVVNDTSIFSVSKTINLF